MTANLKKTSAIAFTGSFLAMLTAIIIIIHVASVAEQDAQLEIARITGQFGYFPPQFPTDAIR